MRKTLVILLFVFGFTTFVNAQFKPTSGFDAEVNFCPFSTAPIQINYLKVRMFLSENMAIRLGLNVAVNNKTEKTDFGTSTTPKIQEVKSSSFLFGFYPGIELHMAGTERLSPYFGAEIGISFLSASSDVTALGGDAAKTAKYEGTWKNGAYDANTTFGINFFCGTDFYVAKHLYLGAEFGFGFSSVSNKDQVYTVTGATPAVLPVTTPGGSSSYIGVNVNSLLRLGWSFN